MKPTIKIICTCFIFAVLLSCRNPVNSNTANNNSNNNNNNNNEKINKPITEEKRGFYLLVNNQSSTTVRFCKGNIAFKTSNGLAGIRENSQAVFLVPFTKYPDGTYPESMKMKGLTIGTTLYPFELPEYEFKLDTKYEITVHGQANNLTLDPIIEKGKIK